jgi:methylenetetrahydrofolate reductase (NADPH)
MEAAEAAGNGQEEGLKIALELVEKVKKLRGQGVHGIHIMAVGWEDIVPRLVTEAGLVAADISPQLAGAKPA